jgi:hypothetical protein
MTRELASDPIANWAEQGIEARMATAENSMGKIRKVNMEGCAKLFNN